MEIKIEKLSDSDIEKQGIKKWPVWEKEPSRFDWSYDTQEQCLLLEGQAKIQTSGGKEVTIQAGDFVTFPKGLQCTWHVVEAVRKHYRFE